MTQETEVRTWGIATVVLVALAVVVFFIQHGVARFVDSVFEICVFYIPAILITLIFFYTRARG